MDLEPVRRFVRLGFEIEQLEAQVSELNKERMALEDTIRSMLIEEGVSNIPLDVDGEAMTVHSHRQLWVKPKKGIERDAVCEALRSCGLDWMVKENFNANTLSSFVREELSNERAIPDEVTAVCDLDFRHRVRATRTSRRESVTDRAARFVKQGDEQGE